MRALRSAVNPALELVIVAVITSGARKRMFTFCTGYRS